MRIGIVGGTGKEGSGLGVRWAAAGHEVLIGSRDPERARGKAAELAARAPAARVSGMSHADAARAAGVVVRAVPAGGLTNAGPIEGITAVLATINRRYKLKNSGIKITGL